jgi:hypothetical protein
LDDLLNRLRSPSATSGGAATADGRSDILRSESPDSLGDRRPSEAAGEQGGELVEADGPRTRGQASVPSDPDAGARMAADGPEGEYAFSPGEAGDLAFQGIRPVPKPAMSGQVAGPASDARPGESSLAGFGSEALFGDGLSGDLDFTFAERMLITDQEPNGDGRRIQLSVAPDENQAFIPLSAASLPDGASWVRTMEEEVARATIAASRREIVRRYFLPAPEVPSR